MKTAEEWIRSFNGEFKSSVATLSSDDIKAIQADALRGAAEIAGAMQTKDTTQTKFNFACLCISEAILARAKEIEKE